MTSVTVRGAGLGDVAAIQAVGLLTWPPTYLAFTSPEYVIQNLHRWWSEESVTRSITDESTLVAVEAGEVVGVSVVGRLDGAWVIWKIYVLPRLHGTGVASQLMAAVVAVVPQGEDVLIEFVEGNARALRFYEKSGFAVERVDGGPLGTSTVWMRRPARSPDDSGGSSAT